MGVTLRTLLIYIQPGLTAVFVYARWLSVTVSTTAYHVLSDEFHSYRFRLQSRHLQAVKMHEIKMTNATSFLYFKFDISVR